MTLHLVLFHRQVAALAITAQFTDATMTIIAGELVFFLLRSFFFLSLEM